MGICSRIQGSLYFLRLQSGWNAAGGKSLDQMGPTLRLKMLTVFRVYVVLFDLKLQQQSAVLATDNKKKIYFQKIFSKVKYEGMWLLCFNFNISIFKLEYMFFQLDHQHWVCCWVYPDVLPHGAEICPRFWQMISFSLIRFRLQNHTSPFGV